jgi:hypothetical protein
MNTFPFATRRKLAVIAVAVTALAGIAIGPPSASAHDSVAENPALELSKAQQKTIRKATKKFRDVDAALAAGYVPTEECVALPDGGGGMGFHYVNPGYLMDGVIDPTKPEILLYHVDDDDELKLGGVEYFAADADQDLTTDADRPDLYGKPFDGPMPGHGPDMPVHYDLHVWLYTDNPAGTLAPWNTEVSCPAPDAAASADHHG